jgi:hypothetical protein
MTVLILMSTSVSQVAPLGDAFLLAASATDAFLAALRQGDDREDRPREQPSAIDEGLRNMNRGIRTITWAQGSPAPAAW